MVFNCRCASASPDSGEPQHERLGQRFPWWLPEGQVPNFAGGGGGEDTGRGGKPAKYSRLKAPCGMTWGGGGERGERKILFQQKGNTIFSKEALSCASEDFEPLGIGTVCIEKKPPGERGCPLWVLKDEKQKPLCICVCEREHTLPLFLFHSVPLLKCLLKSIFLKKKK